MVWFKANWLFYERKPADKRVLREWRLKSTQCLRSGVKLKRSEWTDGNEFRVLARALTLTQSAARRARTRNYTRELKEVPCTNLLSHGAYTNLGKSQMRKRHTAKREIFQMPHKRNLCIILFGVWLVLLWVAARKVLPWFTSAISTLKSLGNWAT